MNNLKSTNRSLALSTPLKSGISTLPSDARQGMETVHRLMVLIPSLDIDLGAVTNSVWKLANASGMHVFLLNLYDDRTQELGLRRGLATMSAIIKDERVSVETDAVYGNDWVDVLKTRLQPGDMIVCFAEQHAGSLRGSLGNILESDLGVPIYILPGFNSLKRSLSAWKSQIAVWAGSIVAILGFSLFQVRIYSPTQALANNILLLLSIPIEVCVIWAWNSLFE